MIDKLINLLKLQEQKLNGLLKLLEKQYDLIMNEKVFELEAIVDELKVNGKEIAKLEVDRKNLIGNIEIKQYIEDANSKELTENYETIKQTLSKVVEQKETNDLLLKQRLLFTNKMLAILTPDRQIKTYNSYGGLIK